MRQHNCSGGKPTPAKRQEPVSKDQMLKEMTEAGVERAIIVPVATPDGARGRIVWLETPGTKAQPSNIACDQELI
jgi:formylmethanofuran:tetrahydromethanopterin formyltransferase